MLPKKQAYRCVPKDVVHLCYMDLIGKAVTNYVLFRDVEPIQVFIDRYFDSEMPASVFLRPFGKLKTIEKEAIRQSRGHVLDVGSGAGNYTLELQKRGLQVLSLELSDKLVQIQINRGVRMVVQQDILTFHEGRYDTILLMMNGFGLARELSRLPAFLNHLKSLLKPGGQILGDSTDIQYFSRENAIRGRQVLPKEYIGNVLFELRYKGETEEFKWVYPDPEVLISIAEEIGLRPEIIRKGHHYSFLIRMTLDA